MSFKEFAPEIEWQEKLKSGQCFLDVRAPIEFVSGHTPQAKNIAILEDQERHLIGLEYKLKGNESATRLGHQIVSGENKNKKIQSWIAWHSQNPESLLYCFRGGQRSQITQAWLKESGHNVPRIQGGYKVLRNYLIELMQSSLNDKSYFVLSGLTGSGKSHFLQHVPKTQYLDLEKLANHKGSSFGAELSAQPAQAQFENELALAANKANKKIIVEDESRTIGKIALPQILFQRMCEAPLLVLLIDEQIRIENIYEDYVTDLFLKLQKQISITDSQSAWNALFERHEASLKAISKRLGGLKFQEIHLLLKQAFAAGFSPINPDLHYQWIQQLLQFYYDPLYQRHIEKNAHRVLKKAPFDEMRHFIDNDFQKL